jgi:Rrf2 family iron-sulfur cluster assembly transcriptional regulator
VKISLKADYAVRALLDLAIHAPARGGIRSSDIAQRTRVPRKFLEAILLELRKAGFVASKRGPDGGHWMACDPARVTVGAILEAIDGRLSTARPPARSSGAGADACLQSMWARADRAIHAVVDSVTLEDLRREADTEAALDFCI